MESESDIDLQSLISKTEEEYRAVVDRGKEGFDMPELFNVEHILIQRLYYRF